MNFKFYQETNFKQTEIGPLPQDWHVVRLGEVVEKISNGITKTQNKNKIGYLVTRIESISDGTINQQKVGYIENLTEDEITKYKLNIGDIIISHINSEPQLGNCAIYEGKPPLLIHGMNLLRIRVNLSKLNYYFLLYLFNFYKSRKIFVSISSRAVNQSSINQQKFKNLPIPLPPLSEQKAIAEVLQTIQEAKEKTEAVIEATRELKKSMMKYLFTYGVANFDLRFANKVNSIENPKSKTENLKSQIKLKDTEIGPIPEHWQVVRLGEVAEIKSGGTPSKKEKTFWENGKIPWIRSEKCQDCFIYDTDEFITEKGLSNSSAKIFEKNTVLIAMVGATIGKTGYLMFPSSTNQNVAGLKPMNANILDSLFLFYSLQNRYYDFAKEGGYKIANLSFIKSFSIPLPPLSEQKAIAEILQAIDEKIEKEEAKKKALEYFFKSMLNKLMSGKLRVNIVES